MSVESVVSMSRDWNVEVISSEEVEGRVDISWVFEVVRGSEVEVCSFPSSDGISVTSVASSVERTWISSVVGD